MTKLVIENVKCQILDLHDYDVIKKIDSMLSYYVQGHEFTKAYKSGWWNPKKKKFEKWDGKNHLLTDKLRFHTGFLKRVEALLNNNNIQYEIVDQRKDIGFGCQIKTKNIDTREYQQRVLESALREKGGIIKAATGSGKSIMITQLIADTNIKTMVYVVGVDLLYQMKETFEKFLGTKVGIIGDGQAEVRKINVCSVWTAVTALGQKYKPMDDEDRSKKEKMAAENKSKIAKAIRDSEMSIFDECHMLATDTLQSINTASVSSRYKYGFSGTPWRDSGDDLLIEAICGKTIIDVTASELINDGFLVPPTIHFVDVPEKANLPDEYPSIYKDYIVENDVRNNKIIKAASKLVESGRRVLILVKNIRHGEILLEELEHNWVVYFVKGDLDSDERNWVREEFIRGDIDIIIASVVYDQGVDLPNLDALILAGSGKSSGRALQRIGRVIRTSKGKKDAIVIDFIDNAKYLLRHTHERIKIYRTEAGFNIKLPERKKDNDAQNKTQEKGRRVQTKKYTGKVSW